MKKVLTLSFRAQWNEPRRRCNNPLFNSSCNSVWNPNISWIAIMAAEGDNNVMRYVYMGQEVEVIPRHAIAKSSTWSHSECITVYMRRNQYIRPNLTARTLQNLIAARTQTNYYQNRSDTFRRETWISLTYLLTAISCNDVLMMWWQSRLLMPHAIVQNDCVRRLHCKLIQYAIISSHQTLPRSCNWEDKNMKAELTYNSNYFF